jgi:FkbM family methyltransferase
MPLIRWLRRDRAWVGRLAARLGTVRIEGCRFVIDSPLISDELKSRLFYRRYERTERALIRRHLPPSLAVIELGGGMGVVSNIVNSRLRDPSRHVVLEPPQALHPLLEANRALNQARYRVVHGAIGYGTAVVGLDAGHDLLGTTTTVLPRARTAPAVTLETLADSHGFRTCAVICDIEGAEVDLVAHELETLKRRVALLVLEEHPERVAGPARQAMFEALAGAGFVRRETLRKVSVHVNPGIGGS